MHPAKTAERIEILFGGWRLLWSVDPRNVVFDEGPPDPNGELELPIAQCYKYACSDSFARWRHI